MSTLVFVELEGGNVKGSSLEAVSYASQMGGDVACIAFGNLNDDQPEAVGAAGASKLLHVTDEKLASPNIMAYSSAIAQAMESGGYSNLVLAKSSLGDPDRLVPDSNALVWNHCL